MERMPARRHFSAFERPLWIMLESGKVPENGFGTLWLWSYKKYWDALEPWKKPMQVR